MDDKRSQGCVTHFIQLEVLSGCRWSCIGCYVDRERTNGLLPGDEHRLENLCKAWRDQGDFLKDITIGPTDFMTARDTRDILDRLRPTFELFDGDIVFSTTMLNKDIDEWAAYIRGVIPKHVRLRLNMVLDYRHIDNQKYLDVLKKNVDIFESIYDREIRCYYTLPTVIGKPTDKVYLPRDLYRIQEKLVETFGEFNGNQHGVTFARTDDFKGHNKRILNSLLWLNRVYDTITEDDPDCKVHLPYSDFSLPPHFHYSYSKGKWFHTPLFYDELVITDESFEIPVVDWVPQEFNRYYDEIVMKQFMNLEGKPCATCDRMSWCAQRFVIDFMDRLEVNQCLMPRDTIERYLARFSHSEVGWSPS